MSDSKAGQLRDEWRQGVNAFVKRRRGIVACSVASACVLGAIGLYQTGIVKHLPPRSGLFDAERVHGSKEAFAMLETPDALLGMMNYTFTAALASSGGAERFRTAPWISFAMGAKLTLDMVAVAALEFKAWNRWRTLSPWSLAVLGASVVNLSLAMPELMAAKGRFRARTR